ncbi:unnamed protein product [Phyllotreta striolata]|uniref:Uncharacterized protein n=1 Tax=Phyllotreta striolata TaxID=444603 RepID=A0A9N9XRP3_PHYSR|nr:unnamed protein product [Phyllotreta striolata]
MEEPADTNALWVNLSSLGDGNIFAVLPQIIKQMMNDSLTMAVDDFDDVVLPSDETWRTKIYYQLVEKQRQIDKTGDDEPRDSEICKHRVMQEAQLNRFGPSKSPLTFKVLHVTHVKS